jgi:tripartite-type tricarboxylate transporter receptor subunit TctC
MCRKIFICLVLVLSLYSGMVWAAGEEKWPTKPIEIIVGFSPGGPSDMGARTYAPIMSRELGVPVVVVNKPGAGGTLAIEYITKAKPDGYTLIEAKLDQFSNRIYTHHVNFTVDDFTYILSHSSTCASLLVRQEAPWKDYKDFLEYARKAPGLTFGTTSPYGPEHIAFDWITRRERVKFSIVPFKGAADVLTGLLGGHIDCGASSGGHAPLVEAGRLRTLLQFSGRASDKTKVPYLMEVYPDLPEDLQSCLLVPKGLTGPKGIPTPVVQKLANALRKATESDEFKRYAERENYQIVVWDSAKIYENLKRGSEAYGKYIKQMGFVKK